MTEAITAVMSAALGAGLSALVDHDTDVVGWFKRLGTTVNWHKNTYGWVYFGSHFGDLNSCFKFVDLVFNLFLLVTF